MIDRLLIHCRLIGKLFKDSRVNIFYKLIFILIPLAFVFVPWACEVPDFLPVLGLCDDLLIILLGSILFRSLAPKEVVEELLNEAAAVPRIESLRHPAEDHALAKGLLWFIISVTLLGSAFGYIWLGLCLIVYLIRKRYIRKRIKMSNPLPVEGIQGFWTILNRVQNYFQEHQFRVVVYPAEVSMSTFVHTREGYIWLVSQAVVEAGDTELLKKQAALYAACVLLGHYGLRTMIESDLIGLARLIFRKWLDCAQVSEEQVAEMICSSE